jgi:hypothetical protein
LRLSQKEERPTFFSFTLTELSGERFYGATLQAWERYTPAQLEASTSQPVTGEDESDPSLAVEPATEVSEEDSGAEELRSMRTDDSFSFLTSRTDVGGSDRAPTAGASTERSEAVFVPRTICLLSRFPYFSVLRECLRELFLVYRGGSELPVEAFVAYLTRVLPVPLPGSSATFQMLHKKVTYLRPSQGHFSLSDVSELGREGTETYIKVGFSSP